jgi:hypothetical protein
LSSGESITDLPYGSKESEVLTLLNLAHFSSIQPPIDAPARRTMQQLANLDLYPPPSKSLLYQPSTQLHLPSEPSDLPALDLLSHLPPPSRLSSRVNRCLWKSNNSIYSLSIVSLLFFEPLFIESEIWPRRNVSRDHSGPETRGSHNFTLSTPARSRRCHSH